MKPTLVRDFETPPGDCPKCGEHFVGRCTGAKIGSPAPVPGDITICMQCQTALVFTPDMQRRLATDEEIAALPAATQAMLAKAHLCLGLAKRMVRDGE